MTPDEAVEISRASGQLRSHTYNAVFDCRVLSKPQAVLTTDGANFYIADKGSSNGTFINSFRLSRTGEESEVFQIYTGDLIRSTL